MRTPRPITAFGETHNISEWARRVGVSRERMRQRLAKYTPEVAVGTPCDPNYQRRKGDQMKSKMAGISQNRPLTINEETHLLKEWAKLSKVNPATICSRIGSGWSERDAVWVRPGMPRPKNGSSAPPIAPARTSPLDAIKMELGRLKQAIDKNRTEREALKQEESAMVAEVGRIVEALRAWDVDAPKPQTQETPQPNPYV